MAKLLELRKAKMKKNTTYKFGKRLSIGDVVLILTRELGRGIVQYTASKPDDDTILARSVTASMFEFTEEETFVVFVKRTITSYRNVEVKAKTKKEAQQKALDLAPDLEFGEIETEHETNGVLTETEHKNLFI